MKIPEKAPDTKKNRAADWNIFAFSGTEGLARLIRKANDEYLYWDKFKYMEIPKTLSAEDAWAYLKMIRFGQQMELPLKDKDGKNFNIWLPDSIIKILHEVDMNSGGQILVDDANVARTEKERYLVSSLIEEALTSSQLEGAATTRRKAKEMIREGRKPRTRAEKMVLNNYVTIRDIVNMTDRPLTKEMILGLQASMTKDTLDRPEDVGRFRSESDDVEVVDKDGTVLFVPPHAGEIDSRIEALCDFANSDDKEIFIHPVVKGIILHFWLAYVHPFVDGNGRTARAIFYWYLLKNKYWLFEYVSISSILLKAPSQYARAYLYTEMDDQDLTYFVMFNLKTIDLAIRSLHVYIRRKQKERKDAESLLKHHPGLNVRQYDLLSDALTNPDAVYTIKYQKNKFNVTYQTARTDLLELARLGLLKKIRRGRQFCFISADSLDKKLRSEENYH